MSSNRSALHVVVANRDGFVEAQLLELAIAVSAHRKEDILKEVEHAIVCEYEIAVESGLTPFVSLVERAPTFLKKEYGEARFEDMGVLQLPAAVSQALAAVLHAPKPVLHIYSKAA